MVTSDGGGDAGRLRDIQKGVAYCDVRQEKLSASVSTRLTGTPQPLHFNILQRLCLPRLPAMAQKALLLSLSLKSVQGRAVVTYGIQGSIHGLTRPRGAVR
jgi:hypothetical protein